MAKGNGRLPAGLMEDAISGLVASYVADLLEEAAVLIRGQISSEKPEAGASTPRTRKPGRRRRRRRAAPAEAPVTPETGERSEGEAGEGEAGPPEEEEQTIPLSMARMKGLTEEDEADLRARGFIRKRGRGEIVPVSALQA